MLAAPPSTGKTSRRASVLETGRGSTNASPNATPQKPLPDLDVFGTGNDQQPGAVKEQDPFATIAQGEPDPFDMSTPADPFATSATSAADPFATGAGAPKITVTHAGGPDAGVEDPFAMLDLSGAPSMLHPTKERKISKTGRRRKSSAAADGSRRGSKTGKSRKESIFLNEDSDSESECEEVKGEVEKLKRKAKLQGRDKPLQPTPPQGKPQLKATVNVDVLEYMKKGTPFLKYGKRGYPHFRQFKISDDNQRLVWFSKHKKLRDSQIELRKFEELRLGQNTPVFLRHPAPELVRSSFSLMYNNRKSSVDLIAKDPNEFAIWSVGLVELIKRAKKGTLSQQTEDVVLPVSIRKGRRSSMTIMDTKTGELAFDPRAEQVEIRARRRSNGGAGSKLMYKEVKHELDLLKRKMNKYAQKLKDRKYYMSTQFDAMTKLLKSVQDAAARCDGMYNAGDYSACDDECWRAGVELESLGSMMGSVTS